MGGGGGAEILVPSSVSPSSSLVLSEVTTVEASWSFLGFSELATVEVAGGLPQPVLVEVRTDCLK
jgi:hypothetical protein